MIISNLTFIVIIFTVILITYLICLNTIKCNMQYKINFKNNNKNIKKLKTKKIDNYDLKLENFQNQINIENRKMKNMIDDIELINRKQNKTNNTSYVEKLLWASNTRN